VNGRALHRGLFAGSFCLAGLMHFVATDFYTARLPRAVPAAALLVRLAGVFEISAALLTLVPRYRRRAALALAVFLAAVTLLNLSNAIAGASSPLLLLRVPLLALLALWAGTHAAA